MTPNAPGLKVAGKKKKKNLNALCLEWSEGGSETMSGRLPVGEERTGKKMRSNIGRLRNSRSKSFIRETGA
jgi:hypothetical protein